MEIKAITPILNVCDFDESLAWFEKLGWKKKWGWTKRSNFASVASGDFEIFLSLNGQGSRGKGDNISTFGQDGDETKDKGVWLSIWVDNVDEIYDLAKKSGIEVVLSPENMPWGVRECHLRHPDGHIFRISQ